MVLLYTTWPDAETCEAVAAEAVSERLAACVNVLGSGRSIYRWEGAIERSVETIALFKTCADRAERLMQLILDRHPYETPAVAALPVQAEGSNAAYLGWVRSETD